MTTGKWLARWDENGGHVYLCSVLILKAVSIKLFLISVLGLSFWMYRIFMSSICTILHQAWRREWTDQKIVVWWLNYSFHMRCSWVCSCHPRFCQKHRFFGLLISHPHSRPLWYISCIRTNYWLIVFFVWRVCSMLSPEYGAQCVCKQHYLLSSNTLTIFSLLLRYNLSFHYSISWPTIHLWPNQFINESKEVFTI